MAHGYGTPIDQIDTSSVSPQKSGARATILDVLTTYGPGIELFVVGYLWTNRSGGMNSAVFEGLLQNVGTRPLSQQPLRSMWWTHIQPPGLSAIYALVVRTPRPMFFLSALWFLSILASIVLVVRTLRELGASRRFAGWTGAFFGILPSTVLVSLFPYSTAFIMFLVALQFWALAGIRRAPLSRGSTWVLAALGLYLVRPSFVWLVALPWIAVPWILLGKSTPNALRVAVSVGLLAVVLVQAHFLASFGMLTTSSWSGQNYVHGLYASGAIKQSDLLQAAGTDRCLLSIAMRPRFFGGLSSFDPSCFTGHTNVDAQALVLGQFKTTQFEQPNSLQRLQLSDQWDRMAFRVLRRHPFAVAKMWFGWDRRPSSFELLLRPATFYDPYWAHVRRGGPLLSIGRPVEAFASPVLGALVLVGAFRRRRRRGQTPAPGPSTERDVFRLGCAFLAYAAIVGSVLDYGENMRFLQEVYPALVLLAAMELRARATWR